MDKNKAVINFLLTCDYVKNSPLFYILGQVEADNKQVVTIANDVNTDTPYIDGSVKKRYTFTLIDYQTVTPNAVISREDVPVSENLDNAFKVQQVLDWITEQATLRNFPDFGSDSVIDDMTVGADQPNLNGVDRAVTPVLAKYSISIRIDYIDYSKAIWK